MFPQTCMRAYCAQRLCRELQTVAVVGGLSSSSSSPSSSSSSPSSPLSNSASTLFTQRETRRSHFVVKRRWWLPHIPNLEDVSKYPYNEHERGEVLLSTIIFSSSSSSLLLYYIPFSSDRSFKRHSFSSFPSQN